MHRPSIRRFGVGTLLTLLASLFAVGLANPAAALVNQVDNNGYWMQTATGGLIDFVGNSTAVTSPVALPECSDGINNDEARGTPGTFQDTLVDYPADPECASASDSSEVQAGAQAKAPVTFGSFITKAGLMTSLAGTWPPSYIYTTSGLITFSVGVGAGANSTFSALTGDVTINLNLTIAVHVEAGATAFTCTTPAFPVSLSTTDSHPANPIDVTPAKYSATTGMATVADNNFVVPPTQNSLVQGFCDQVNAGFGLPVYNASTPTFSTPGSSALQFDIRSFPATSVSAMNNHQPTATVGANQSVAYGAPVTLTGGGTDTDPVPAIGTPPTPGPIFYKWTQTAGPAVPSFSQTPVSTPGANVFVQNPTFTPPSAGDYTFELDVADGAGVTYSPTTATTSVHVALPTAPVAGDDSYSTPFDTPLTDAAPGVLGNDSGTGISVTGNTSPSHGSVTLGADGALSYTPTTGYVGSDSFTYTITDAASQTSTATVNLSVDNTAPAANAGSAQNVLAGAHVTLDGSASYDPDSGPSSLSYSWTQTGGPTVSLSGATTASPSFTAPTYYCNAATDFTFQLTVDDGAATNSATVTVTDYKVSGSGTPQGDYNGDGTADPAVYNQSTATWQIRCQGTFQFGAAGDIAVPGDYNGDGTTDVATYTPKTSPGGNGTWVGNEGLWKIRGQLSFRFAGLQNDIPVPADYFGDGAAHAALFRPSTAEWIIRPLGAPQFGPVTAIVVQFGQSGDIPIPWDYDGDGAIDLALYRPSTGQWIIGHGLSPVSPTISKPNFPLNLKPMVADYTGDGRGDIMAIDPTTGKWYQGGHGNIAVAWGQAGDVGFSGDYNGNGVVEIGRYRNSSVAVIDGQSPFYFGGAGFLPVSAGYTTPFTGGG